IHDVPASFFSKTLAKQLGESLGTFLEYDGANMGKGYQNFLRAGIFRYEHNLEEPEHKVVSGYVREKNEQWESVAIEIGHLKVEYGV
ncbi:hypothetical protein Gotri_016267, partial [Gossypium trilobum]|nr:hypothetical protein [Gossypium trilobum]